MGVVKYPVGNDVSGIRLNIGDERRAGEMAASRGGKQI